MIKFARLLAFLSAFFCTSALATEGGTPMTVTGATTIEAAEAKALFDQGVAFVDPRSSADFDAGRIPEAYHLDINSDLTETALLDVVSKDEPVVFYCNGPKCGRSAKSCAKAVEWGFTKVYYFRDGMPGWMAAGYPVE